MSGQYEPTGRKRDAAATRLAISAAAQQHETTADQIANFTYVPTSVHHSRQAHTNPVY